MAFDDREGAPAFNPYSPVMGKTYVDLDETGDFTVLDPRRIALVAAWTARIIPGNADWPGADGIATAAYVDAVLRKAPELRPIILAGADAVDAAARARTGSGFDELPTGEQVEILRDAERTLAPEAFSVILELTYEAYYRTPLVQENVKVRTGFNIQNTVVDKPMEPFPVGRLTEVSLRPSHYRSVPA